MKRKMTLFNAAVICCMLNAQTLFSQADVNLSNLAAPTAVGINLLPATDNARNLGSPALSWKNIYADGYIFIDGDKFINNEGTENVFIGPRIGNVNTGTYNTFTGSNAGINNTSGSSNSFFGAGAGYSTISAFSNTFIGRDAGRLNTYGFGNTFSGHNTGYDNDNGSYNSFYGYGAGNDNVDGDYNTYIGSNAGVNNISGSYNTFSGYDCGFNTTSSSNTMSGYFAGYWNTTGYENVFIGKESGYNNVTGYENTFVGKEAGHANTSGFHNTYIGYNADDNTLLSDYDNATGVGYNATITATNQIRLGNSSVTSIGGYAGWSNISDGRFKKNVQEDVVGLDFILRLRPVTYNLDINGINSFLHLENEETNGPDAKGKIIYTGFIAQEVEAIAAETGYDFSGVDAPKNETDMYGLRYAEFVVPIVKAIQEQQIVIENKDEQMKDLQLQINTQQKQIDELYTLLNAQNPAVEKTSDEIYNIHGASLEDNIPNPFINETKIRFTIPATFTSAQIIINDISGRIVKTFQINNAGSGEVAVYADELMSGTYQYTLWIDGQKRITKKMVISR
ncbi:MAG: tail fiber domain-containing protein [Chitinophagales bacterium]|nr:tail fiber domain-containing protein [Chitinophagales bacterium]